MREREIFGSIFVVGALVGLCCAGYCQESFSCNTQCGRKTGATYECGGWWWSRSRCSRYRTAYYTCSKTCYRQKCCKYYTGGGCRTPLCGGLTSCPNGGTCVSPNRCICPIGFSSPRCDDIDECKSGTTGCMQDCTNTIGSFKCTCFKGYVRSRTLDVCIDDDECVSNNGGCEHNCSNAPGSFQCWCKEGYELNNKDRRTCSDIDECKTGTARCDHGCANTVGSYQCSCKQGYTLLLDGTTCEDIDECTDGTGVCDELQTCQNTIGAYTCVCSDGYRFDNSIQSCQDANECLSNNGQCSQKCTNNVGSYSCDCFAGFVLDSNQLTCSDINECQDSSIECSATCINTPGSYMCGCTSGYTLAGDSSTCIDIDECDVLNGGCQDVCTNTNGSFLCSCSGDVSLSSDFRSCQGSNTNSVFQRLGIARQLLPQGCSDLPLTKCTDGKDVHLYLSSTSEWYTLRTDARISFTFGIVFVKISSLSLPVSLNGVTVFQDSSDFQIQFGVNKHEVNDGVKQDNLRTADCITFELTANDVFEFVSSNSFQNSYLTNLFPELPNWIEFANINTSVLAVHDLKTDLIYGRYMDNDQWCQGAPVQPEHLYSVFRFGTGFSLSVYGKEVKIPSPLHGNKFCLIVDICNSYGGSLFLMVPEESRNFLTELDVFKNLYDQHRLLLQPRGIGLSIKKQVNVHYRQGHQLQLWNGDQQFNYPVFKTANLWIGGNVLKESNLFRFEGNADIYLSASDSNRMLTAMFLDEWNLLIDVGASATATVNFELFGKPHTLIFDDLATANLDVLMSVGGTDDRKWCGETSNPAGIFLSFFISINPFRNIPILKDWLFDFSGKIQAYITTDSSINVTASLKIDISDEITEFYERVTRFKELIKRYIEQFGASLNKTTRLIKLENATERLQQTISANTNKIKQRIDTVNVINVFWRHFKKVEQTLIELMDFIKINKNVSLYNDFSSSINDEIADIRKTINTATISLTKQIGATVGDYSGFGLKCKVTLSIFGSKLFGVDLEIVYSAKSIGGCSRFDKVYRLLQGQKAYRFLGRVSRERKLGHFLTADEGFGFGGAIAVASNNVIFQFTAYIDILGIKVTGDVFLNRNGIYFYLEGNIWGVFFVQLDVSAEHGEDWYKLKFNILGRLVAKVRNKRQTQTVSTSFQDSYLDALIKITRMISDEANTRLSQAQKGLTSAQNGISKAQNWLKRKKDDIDSANTAFDKAIDAFKKAKRKLDDAKEPFEKALKVLEKAQKNVDNLCRIRTCGRICIPGLKCRWCTWYPCCKWTRCMFSFPEPFCSLANLACRIIRGIAYAVLETAKILVRIPMLAFDIAKAALTVAEVVVDKSRFVLSVAKGILDIAIVGLEAAKGILEHAKIALEAVKIVIGAAMKILEFVIEHGLKNIIDVRNCGFNIEISTYDWPVFDVQCEINAFKSGWQKVGMSINFKNPLQSIWQAAKATFQAIMKVVGGLFSGRKRREIEFDASSRIHTLIRKIRAAENDQGFLNATHMFINETMDSLNITQELNTSSSSDYDNRVLSFQIKCSTITNVQSFLRETFVILYDITNDTKNQIHEAIFNKEQPKSYQISNITENITLESSGINIEYAKTDYNLTAEELETALEDVKKSMSTDPLLIEIASAEEYARENSDAEIRSIDNVQLLSQWIFEMENKTKAFYEDMECVSFRDCVFHSISSLYDLYTAEYHPNITDIEDSISSLEENVLGLFANESSSIDYIYNKSAAIDASIRLLSDLNLFCSKAPRFLKQIENQTAIRGKDSSIQCEVDADPFPVFWWYKNNEILDENSAMLMIVNVTNDDAAIYKCMAGNIVANITSNEIHLFVTEPIIRDEATEEPDAAAPILVIVLSVLAGMIVIGVLVFTWKRCASYSSHTGERHVEDDFVMEEMSRQ